MSFAISARSCFFDKKPFGTVTKSDLGTKKVSGERVIYYDCFHIEKQSQQLDKLKETVIAKRPELTNRRGVIVFQQGNTRPRVISLIVGSKRLLFDHGSGMFYLILHTLRILPRVITIYFDRQKILFALKMI